MTPLRTRTLALMAALASLGFVGCTTEAPGRPSPGASASGPTAPTTSKPAFDGPELDLGKFADKPCDLLNAGQLAQLGTFDAPKPDKDSFGSHCTWQAKQVLKGSTYEVTLLTNGSTIEQIAESSKGVPVYRQTRVSGYPAVSSDATNGRGNCTTAVGTSSKDAILVQISVENPDVPEHKDSCTATEKVAALVVGNLKG